MPTFDSSSAMLRLTAGRVTCVGSAARTVEPEIITP